MDEGHHAQCAVRSAQEIEAKSGTGNIPTTGLTGIGDQLWSVVVLPPPLLMSKACIAFSHALDNEQREERPLFAQPILFAWDQSNRRAGATRYFQALD
jgi:hypothetical protein